MKNCSTPLKSIEITESHTTDFNRQEPRKSTISFLRQFARAYTCVAAAPVALSSFVAN